MAGMKSSRVTAFTTAIGGDGDNLLPERFSLSQNYPNPFNPSTTISFALTSRVEVRLEVFDITGRVVRTIELGELPAGYHDAVWNGKSDGGEPVASGMYLYRLIAGDFVATRKMMLLK